MKKNLPLIPTETSPADFERIAEEKYNIKYDTKTVSGKEIRLRTISDVSGDGVGAGDAKAKVKMHLNTMIAATDCLLSAKKDPGCITTDRYFESTADLLRPYLDAQKGHLINPNDYGIFTKLTEYWTDQFHTDLDTLNCLKPTSEPKVTEYIPQIVSFVKKVVEKNFAYQTADGSVYFDITAFETAGNNYARLKPENRGDKDLQADGEGALTAKTNNKKSDADFALWKSSKPGEPSWPSPWGKGRPGWHIECSVMASEVIGSRIDIHSGGIDLAFPHHDNELAQSEAYWVGESTDTSGKHKT
jgi:cysteinyl-tRNA synthetase